MKILIVGAGAMGSRLAIYLHRAGNQVQLLDGWADHVQAIRDHGLVADLNGEEVRADIPAHSFDEYKKEGMAGQSDLIIFLVKSAQLDPAVRLVKDEIHEETMALSLLNGLGHARTLQKYLDKENILLGNTMWTAGLEGPGRVKLEGDGFISLGDLAHTDQSTARAKEVAQVFTEAGLDGRYTEEMGKIIYLKACVNGTANPLSAILEANIGQIREGLGNLDLVHAIAREFIAVARAEGIEMTEEETFKYLDAGLSDESIKDHYPSMYQDLINQGRQTEIDFLNGAVWAKGEEYGIPTPYCQTLTCLVRAKEKLLGVQQF